MFVPLVCAVDVTGKHDSTRLDGMALLFLFVVILVLCMVASCMDDAQQKQETYDAYDVGNNASTQACDAACRPQRARERSPVCRMRDIVSEE